jgi:probable F420-dependent oxidoreductase
MELPLGIGVWSGTLRYGDPGAAAAAAAELESLGYSALWIPDTGGDVFGSLENLLTPTSSVVVATGILNLWMHTPAETAAHHARLTATHGPRVLIGIGVSHAPLIDRAEAGRYSQPLARMREFLDGLDAAPQPLAPDARRPRTQDAGPGPDPDLGQPPLPRHPRAHRRGP